MEVAASCDGQVISLSHWYDHGQLNIVRFTGRAKTSSASIDRIQALEVAGKPAVVIGPIPGEPAALGLDADIWAGKLILVEDFGITIIQTGGVPFEEVIKIAEGIR